MLVVLMGCDACGADRHRGILVDQGESLARDPTGDILRERGFGAVPGPDCLGNDWFVTESEVQGGFVYIVEDGLDLSADTETMKRIEQEAKEAKIDRVLAKVCR